MIASCPMGDDDSGWMVITLDDKIARRQGVPARVPVPKAEFEGLAEKGLPLEQVRKWVAAFLATVSSAWRAENGVLAKQYDAFIAKLDFWKKAQAAFERQDYPTAISAFKMIANIDKEDHAARLNLAAALSNTRDFAQALKHFETIRETYEDDADFHVSVGQVHLALQDSEKAIEEMVLALEAKPDCLPALEALKRLGFLVSIYEDPRDATSLVFLRSDSVVAALSEVWDAADRDTAYWLEQIGYHQSENRADVVLAAAERALAGAAGNEALEAARVSALRALKRTDESIAAAQACLAKTPASSALETELAQSLTAAGKETEAAAAVDRALAIDPGDLMAIALKFGEFDPNALGKAADILGPLSTHVAAHPTSVGAARALARLKIAMGATDDGLALFVKAVALAPEDDDLRTEYWGELRKLRRFDEVIADAQTLTDTGKRYWGLRWSEAETYAALGKKIEARALYMQLNMDTSLQVDIRKRAKRAATTLAG